MRELETVDKIFQTMDQINQLEQAAQQFTVDRGVEFQARHGVAPTDQESAFHRRAFFESIKLYIAAKQRESY